MSDYIKREDAMEPLYEKWKAAESRGDDDIAEIVKMDYITVSNVPSVDVVEVRHGKWSHDYIKDGVSYNDWCNLHCTVCGETQRDAWGKWNYCPYCGAKMDEKEQEHE